MVVKIPNFKKLEELFSKVQSNTEIEASVTKKLTLFQLRKAIQYVKTLLKTNIIENDEVLDISSNGSNTRLSIMGSKNISHFCRNANITSIPASNLTILSKDKKNVFDIKDYNIRFRNSTETFLNYEDEETQALIQSLLSSNKKMYRLKKRYSVLDQKNKLKFDFTIVKVFKDSSKYSSQQQILNNAFEISHEMEIETLNPKNSDIKLMISYMLELLKVVDDVEFLMSNQEKENILIKYLSLTQQSTNLKYVLERPKRFFVGPQPVTLENQHFSSENSVNIYDNYTVTIKADGERHLVFVDENGDTYLINNRLNVKKTGLKSTNFNSLFDSEVVDRTVMLFDCYVFDNGFKLDNILLSKDKTEPSRIKFAQEFSSSIKKLSNNIYNINVKDFYLGTNEKNNRNKLFGLIKEIIYKQYPFETDGIIFTPSTLPVGYSPINKQDKLVNGTWDYVLKWKPPEQNTIDVLVKEDYILSNSSVGVFNMYCGKNTSSYESSYSFIKSKCAKLSNEYKEFSFCPMLQDGTIHDKIRVGKNDNVPFIETNGVNEQIMSDIIVEISFDLIKKQWKIIRIRHDKTELFKHTGKISQTANDYNTASSIWNTIINPISIDMLTGESPIDFTNMKYSELEDDKYYDRVNKNRNESLTISMKDFHNEWVKKFMLIRKTANVLISNSSSTKNKISLFDPTCGEAGDLFKWIASNIETVIGTDLYKTNIYQINGANDRLCEAKRHLDPKSKYIFFPLDFSKDITKTIVNGMDNINNMDKHLAKLIWGEVPNEFDRDLKPYYNLAKGGFDIISCQFSLHYFFESEKVIDTFINNIDSNLKKGGYFIGTVFDGKKVDKLLNDNNGMMIGTKLHNNKENIIWRLKKKYNTYSPYGSKIGVTVETINEKEMDEYLVDLPVLFKKLEQKQIFVLSKNDLTNFNLEKFQNSVIGFSELFNDMQDYVNSNENNSEELNLNKLKNAVKMSPSEKQLSFMYTSFIFKKY